MEQDYVYLNGFSNNLAGEQVQLDFEKKLLEASSIEERADLFFQFWLANRGMYTDYIQKEIEILKKDAEKNDNDYARGWYYYILGWIASDSDQYDKSMDLLDLAYERFQIIDNKWALSNTINGQAINFIEGGALDKGLERFLLALELAEEVGDGKLAGGIACNIGSVLILLKQYDEAIEYFQKSEQFDLGVPSETSILLCNFGQVYRISGRLEKAEEKIREALRVNPGGLSEAFAIQELALIRFAQKKFAEAEKYFKDCLELSREQGRRRFEASSLLHLGLIEKDKGNLEEALANLEEALTIAQEITSNDLRASILVALADVYEGIGDCSNGFKALREGKEIEGEIFNQELGDVVAALKMQQARRENLIYKDLYNRINTISHIGQAITSNLNIKDIGNIIYKQIMTLMKVDNLVIGLYNKERDKIKYTIVIKSGIIFPEFTRASVGAGCGRADAIIDRQGFLVNDIAKEEELIQAKGACSLIIDDVKSFVCSPLIIREEILGLMAVQSNKSNSYSAYHVDILNALAAYTAIALENGQLFSDIKELATTDHLTSLANRRSTFEQGEREFAKSLRYDRPLSVIIADIDHFKLVNDTYGHAAGDVVLKGIAALFSESIRASDILGRIGGEEFLFILPNIDISQAMALAGRLCKANREKEHEILGTSIKVTVSFGVSELKLGDEDISELVTRADRALYEAKRGGRDTIRKAD